MAATKSPLVRLGHIRDEIADLLPLFEGADYTEFASSYSMVRTTERAILIIAEAVKTLPSDLTAAYPEIEWHAIRGIGNILRHEYERVETEVLWRVVASSLRQLAPVIDRRMRELGGKHPIALIFHLVKPKKSHPSISQCSVSLPASA
jgi:uncharacterized protein with HEPN domain